MEALKGVADAFGLSIVTSEAAANPGSSTEHYVIKGTSGAHQDPKARLVYVHSGNTINLVWRVETDMYDKWFLSYIDAAGASKILGVVNYVADASYQV